mmetsp:Transcript_74849/g.231373  ORF Transcript_74849/g.231373 Transcript_74849/m.231373 type:complete len:206 (-) Transcript_74849:1984-2601(-)
MPTSRWRESSLVRRTRPWQSCRQTGKLDPHRTGMIRANARLVASGGPTCTSPRTPVRTGAGRGESSTAYTAGLHTLRSAHGLWCHGGLEIAMARAEPRRMTKSRRRTDSRACTGSWSPETWAGASCSLPSTLSNLAGAAHHSNRTTGYISRPTAPRPEIKDACLCGRLRSTSTTWISPHRGGQGEARWSASGMGTSSWCPASFSS